MLGVPVLGVALLLGVPGVIFRVRPLAVPCGMACLLVGGLFLWTLDMAIPADRLVTMVFSAFSVLAGTGMIFYKRKRRT